MLQAIRNNPWHLGLAPMLAWPIVMTQGFFAQLGTPAVAVYFFAISFSMVLILLLESEKPLTARSEAGANILTCLFACAACALLHLDTPSVLPAYVAAVLSGFSAAWGYAAWAQPYARCNPTDSLLLAMTSLGLCALLLLAMLLPERLMVDAAAVCSILAFLCITRLRSRDNAIDQQKPQRTLKENVTLALPLWRIAVGVVTYSFAVGVSWPLLLDTEPFSPLVAQISYSVLIVGLAATAILVVYTLKVNLTFNNPWRVVVLLLSAAILIAPQVDGMALDVVVSFVRTAELAITLLWFLALADVSRKGRLDAGHTVGFGWLFFSLPCAAGVLFGNLLLAVNPLTTVLPALTVLALVAVAFFADDKSYLDVASGEIVPSPANGAANEPSDDAPGSLLDTNCARLAREFGLTERESQIFALLAHGRSGVHIAESLGLSENTIKGHTKRLYVKLGVHSRQELISLVEQA